jgi:predicted ferric reductase
MASKWRPVLIVTVVYLLWPLYQSLDYISVQPFAEAADMVNYVASIFAYDWLLLNILLSLKIPVLQRALPYDFRVRAHIFTSIAIGVFLVWHVVFYLFVNPKIITVVSWALLAVVPVMLVVAALWVPMPGLKWLHKKPQRDPGRKYDVMKNVHKWFSAFLVVMVYLHIIDAKIIGVASPASSFGFTFLFAFTAAAFVATRVRNLLLPTLKVVSVTSRSGLTHLKLANSRRLRYRAGQFAFLRFQHPALRGEEHPFSFTSVPGDVEFAIKDVGDFTKKLSLLAPGDKVKVNGGFGAFRPGKRPRGLAFIGTGVGVAPVVSLLKDMVAHPPRGPVTCIVSAASRADLVEPGWWDQVPTLLPQVKLRVLLGDRGDPLFSEALFAAELGRPQDWDYYLCSSEKVRRVVLGILGGLGVKPRRIHYENFALG